MVLFLINLILIVVAASVFCNALEHLGEKLGVSSGVTGSIFAAIGTALPETIIPLIAIYTANGSIVNHEIGLGAIVGAPLMLSTLSVFLMAIAVCHKRGLSGLIKVESSGLERDLVFFLFSYICALILLFIPPNPFSWLINCTIAVILICSYLLYLVNTIKNSNKLVKAGHGVVTEDKLYIEYLGLKRSYILITIQLLLGLVLLTYCAGLFIDAVKAIAVSSRLPVFLLSLIVIPIATELPEKINSIIWLRKNKDTLALSNITGAMVFQGTLLPVISILSHNWRLENKLLLVSIIITIAAVSWLYINLKCGGLKIWHFIVNGLLYIINIIIFVFHG